MNGSQAASGSTYAAPRGRTRSPLIIDSDWLQDHCDDAGVRVVQVDVAAARFDRAHIPGAVLWNIYTDLRGPQFQLVGRAAVERLVRASGIGAQTLVVFTGYAPALGLWLLQAHGHQHVGLLDGSLETWEGQGRPVTSEAHRPRATVYRIPEANPSLRARREDVQRAIEDPVTAVVDVRSVAEYRGDQFWPSGGQQAGGRAGHIPTAAHVPIDEVLDERGAFRATPDLTRVLAGVELSRADRLITYCTIGARAATTWFVLTHLLGRPGVRVYDGSWAEWGLDEENPVDRGCAADPPPPIPASCFAERFSDAEA